VHAGTTDFDDRTPRAGRSQSGFARDDSAYGKVHYPRFSPALHNSQRHRYGEEQRRHHDERMGCAWPCLASMLIYLLAGIQQPTCFSWSCHEMARSRLPAAGLTSNLLLRLPTWADNGRPSLIQSSSPTFGAVGPSNLLCSGLLYYKIPALRTGTPFDCALGIHIWASRTQTGLTVQFKLVR